MPGSLEPVLEFAEIHNIFDSVVPKPMVKLTQKINMSLLLSVSTPEIPTLLTFVKNDFCYKISYKRVYK